MIREICRDEAFLSQAAEAATQDDVQTASDLLETLEHHKSGCVGMAANMIGVNKRIIAFDNGGSYMVMFNPEIIKKSEPYTAEEGCLSLSGTRRTTRWRSIKVRWQNERFHHNLTFINAAPLSPCRGTPGHLSRRMPGRLCFNNSPSGCNIEPYLSRRSGPASPPFHPARGSPPPVDIEAAVNYTGNTIRRDAG